MSEYLVYWRPETIQTELNRPFDHAASGQFGKIKRGDRLWVVTCENERLFLCGHQEVEDITDQIQAERRLGPGIWEAKYHTLSPPDRVEPICKLDISPIAADLRFDAKVDRLPSNFSGLNLQTIRLLTFESTALLRQKWQSKNGANASRLPERGTKEPSESSFDPDELEDARARIWQEIVSRRGQQAFRDTLLKAYGKRCAISDCAVEDVLEAAHIHPYSGEASNHVSNGLLLRTDLHTLFDLGLIGIDAASFRILVKSRLLNSEYGQFRGKPLRLPSDAKYQPSAKALDEHRQSFGLK